MLYPDGKQVMLGDKVKFGDSGKGIVVASIDTDEFPPDYPKKDWGYLKVGVLIDTDFGGLIHFTEPDEDMVLLERVK